MKLKHIIIALLLISIIGLIFYRISVNNNADKGKASNKPQISKVNGEIIKTQYFEDLLSLTGTIEADEQIELRSEVSGLVQSINFQEGSFVNKGQLLVKINDVELQAQKVQAQTKENLAKENARRAKLLIEKEAISQEEFEIVTAEYLSAKAQTQLITSQIAKTQIKAPFSGKIGLRNISQGTYVTPSTLIAKLVSDSQVKITFSVPEKYATNVNKNSDISFKISGDTTVYKAKIYALESGIEETTRTLRIRAIAQNKDNKLLPGSFATIDLPLSKLNDAILIPTEAVIPVRGGKIVFVKQGGKVVEKEIITANRTNDRVLVLNGLSVGDTLITSGLMTLKVNSPVSVTIQ